MIKNPIIKTDFPDLDVIRVEDTYYMVSTTMHFMPGGVILRSYDLLHWEVASYLYDELDATPAQCLNGKENIYGKGMWAASIRYHKGTFYVCFVANDTQKTYLYQSEDIMGPWRKSYIEGFYHDSSLLFDDDDRIYIVYGNREIYLTELTSDMTGPKPGGLHRVIVKDTNHVILGYEGAHIYKMNGKYYVFFIHWPNEGTKRRVEACFFSDSLEGEFIGKDILDDDMNFHNQGVAQGGIIDTPSGDWYAMLFQDHGAVGRVPVLVPLHWENDFPVLGVNGKVPLHIEVKSTRPEYIYEPLVDNDDFNYQVDDQGAVCLKNAWQWNHTPDLSLWSVTEKPGALRIYSGKLCDNLLEAKNMLTQRMMLPSCEAFVTVNGSNLRDGDYAGICALQGDYGFIAITRDAGKYYLVMIARESTGESIFGDKEVVNKEFARIPIENAQMTLKVTANFDDMIDKAEFYYMENEEWKRLGITYKLTFKLDHFVGCRFGLFFYATKETGGSVDFSNFRYCY
jgi:beta-xylosidase